MATQNPFQTSPFSASDFADTPEEAVRAPIPAPTRSGASSFDPLFERYGKEYNIPPSLLKTLAGKESSFNPKAVGATNANGTTDYGLMQHNSRYHKERGITDWSDPEQSVAAAAKLLRQNLEASGGDLREAVRRYNGSGPAAERYADDVMAKFRLANGEMTVSEYARSVANRVRPNRFGASKPENIDDQFSDTPEGAIALSDSDFVDTLEEAMPAGEDLMEKAARFQAKVEGRPYLDRLTEETKGGFDDMTRSLTTARWALGAGDTNSLAEDLAKSIQEQAKKPKTIAQQEIDDAYKGVSDAKGVVDTTVAGAKALWASLTNPKETSIEIARSAANSLPSLAAGAAGAVGGGAIGSAIPGAGTVVGAIAGGRTGMVLGTTATELGAEVQHMVQKRLEENKQPPTAQNVLAILSDKNFQSEALKQGAAKGLTVAAVDQLFMGLGGKIATAPARKIATKELADAGIDMSTRAARKEALNTAAGQAAIAAAKPTLGAKVGAGAAAVGVDAAGESIGEGASQQVARGEVDYGDALREGVASLGQSAAQTAVGATIEQAKAAASAAKNAIPTSPRAPSTAPGPLARAAENAATAPERVTVTAPDGEVSGTVTGAAPGVVQVTGDDGQVYNFATGPDGVTITPEAPNTPLTNALEVAAEDNAPATPEQGPVVAPEGPVAEPKEVRTANDDGSVSIATWTPKPDGSFERSVRVEPAPGVAEAVAPNAPVTEAAVPSEPPQPKELADMTEPELRARLKFIADQAKPANGGWNKMLVEQRKLVEREINSRAEAQQPKATNEQAPAATNPTAAATGGLSDAGRAEPVEAAGVEVTQPAPTVGATEEGAGTTQPPQAAPTKTASKEDLDHLFGVDKKRAKALERIAAGKAWFNDGVKAKDFITKNGLKDTHEAAKGKGGRWDIVAKATAQEQTNVSDNRTERQPASTEAVVSRQEAKPAEAAPVQPDAAGKEEVAGQKYQPPAAENVFDDWRSPGKSAEHPEYQPTARQQAIMDVVAKAMDDGVFYNTDMNARVAKEMGYTGQVEQSNFSRDVYMARKVVEAQRAEKGAKKVQEELNLKAGDKLGVLVFNDFKVTSAVSVNSVTDNGRTVSIRGKRGAATVTATTSPTNIKYAIDRAKERGKRKDGYDEFIAGRGEVAEQAKEEVADGFAAWWEGFDAKQQGQAFQAVGAIGTGVQTTKASELPNNGITEKIKALHAQGWLPAKQDAPGTRINGDTERAAADRLEKLYEQMGNITNRNSREGNAKAAVRSVIEELRKPKTVVSVAAVLDGAANGLDKNYSAMADVVREVSDSLNGVAKPVETTAATDVDAIKPQADNITNGEAKGNDNEPAQLDQPSPRELAGKQSDAVQGTEPGGQAGASPETSSRTDARGNERTGGERVQQPGGVGDDAREVPASAPRGNDGRSGKPWSSTVQRSERPAKPDSSERGNQPDLTPESGTRAQDRADGFVITDEDGIGEGGAKTKFKQNVAAIRLLKELQAENRQATRAEQAVLAKYVGWGGLPQAFYRDNGEVSKGWEKEAAELKALMTEDELAAAASSTRNAHYTSPEIVQAVWDAAKHFGFQGGRVLEPSVGVGNFFGLMPTAMRSASQLTGVELDHITGGIAKQLYPQANIQAPVGFQDFSAPDNYFELAIGNPPFGREGIYDPTRRKISGFSIHNYFFAKSIDTVKPNGVLAMVVTNRLLDSAGDKARGYIADRAEFLGAIRLPNNAFLKNAGTEVTTDIIFLRKLKEGEQPTGQRWMDVKTIKDKSGKEVPLNEYFVRNPDMMLGEFGAFGTMYRPDDAALVAREGQDTPALMKEAMAKLPKGFMDAPSAEPTRETIEPMHDVSHVKVGSVFEQGGQIYERKEDMLGKQQAVPVVFANEKAKERVSGMIKVRDALIDVRRLQLTDGVKEKTLEASRAALNKAYDAFVKINGPINGDANKRLMRDDPTWPQLAALEDNFDKGISAAVAKTTGEKARPASAQKSAIFTKRTQAPYKAPEKANSAKDALVTSLSERGRVDLDYMASLYGKTPDAIAQELGGLIFKNPVGGWESRDQYLSGNVKKKLAQAIDAAKSDSSLKANVDELRAVQPADIEAVDIDVKTGAHWVPADVMQDFVSHITEGQRIKAIYNPITATWTLDAERVPQSAMTQWSTDRANILKVLESAANQKQITIYDEHRDGTRTLNEAATTSANEKVERVKAEWKNWIWDNDARRERLHRIYNDTFNTDVQREFDGSHLTFPGKVGNDIIQLRPHQANAVWRMVQSGTTLLDHVVGAGKTFTMIAGIMEMRRMGLAQKPMLVVPNHLVGQWAEDFMKLYPGANILAATKKDFEKDNRKKLFARIATGDWDAVIVAHSSFGKVEVEPEFQEQFIKQQIADMDTSISAMRAAEGKSSRNVKQIEKQKAALEEKLKRLFDTGNKDDNLYFNELGVDSMLVDECFTHDTMVETDHGQMKIGEIVNKRLSVSVKSWDSSTHAIEYKPVVNWYANTRRGHLMEVIHESGSFICTPNHKIWIDGFGYKRAADIAAGDHVFTLGGNYAESHEGSPRYSAVRVLRDGDFVSSEQAPEVLQRLLQDAHAARRPHIAEQVAGGNEGNVAELSTQGAHQSGKFGAHDVEQPNGITGDASQSLADAQGYRASTCAAWGEWTADGASTPDHVASAADCGTRHQDGTDQAPDARASECLQGGLGLSGINVGRGAGRVIAQIADGERAGCKEGSRIVACRVVAVAVLERDGDGEYRFCGREHSTVYDIEVADNHNYFANGALVSNCHEFKNLGFSTGMQRVAGLGNPTGSNKAADMFMKVQSVLKRTGGKNVVFATGTPISNTMAEMYTVQRYLDYGTLKDQGIAHFDAWAKTFGEVVTDWELSPSGQYKMNSRFAKFVNMPELMQRYQSFADVINRDDINRQLAAQGKKLPVPKVRTGKPENTVVERSQDQARYIGIPTVDENGQETYPEGSLIWRSENLPKKAEKGSDNMLKIMSDARKAALDMRLIDQNYPDNPDSKVNVAASNIKATYDQWSADKGTQLVFIDLSTPKGAVAKEAAALRELVKLAEEGDEAAQSKLDAMSPDELLALDSSFSVYDDLKAKLIAQGIPENEIAFIHDANTELQKEELFAKVRTGRVRVLFGSTAKMGAGMNVQDRLVALHHLDAPWRPSDLEQREGRIIRQGNKLYEANPEGFEVRIHRYATKQTLDSRMWQTIEAKARFIEQVRKGAGNTREIEDIAGEAANSAEMKAASSGNPLILEEMSLRQAIRKLENQQAEHNREQFRIKDRMRMSADNAKFHDGQAAIMEADTPKVPKEFAAKIGNQTFDKHGEAGEAILAAVDAMHNAGEESREIGTYGGFKLSVDDTSMGLTRKAVLTVTGKGEYQLEANPGSAATGLALRLQNTVKSLAAEAERSRAIAQRSREDIPKLQAQIKPWGHEKELTESKARHLAVVEQLKPKKKEQPKADEPAMSRGQDQTQTPEFKRWFKDSKVVDANGLPLVVYHGTGADITEFKDVELRNGFYFADSPEYADLFAEGESANILPVYLSIQNPADMRGEISFDMQVALRKAGYSRVADLRFANPRSRWKFFDGDSALREALEASGYDGARLVEPDPGAVGNGTTSWVAFRPEQIKSAIGNNGQFDPANPDIRMSRADDVAQYIESKFWNVLGDLEDAGLVTIKC